MTILHVIGDQLRNAFSLVPLSVARMLFVAVPLLLLCWVLTLPRSAVIRENGTGNLRWWAVLALLIQIAIYTLI